MPAGPPTVLRKVSPSCHTECILHSSDSSPSYHSSIYDALLASSSSERTSDVLDEDHHRHELNNARESSGRRRAANVDEQDETQLFTIKEQASITTLKTVPSNWTFQQRIMCVRAATFHSHMSMENPDGQRKCMSLDENAMQYLHRQSEDSQHASARESLSEQSSDQTPQRPAPKPAEPVYPPPKRERTPVGVPPWPPRNNGQVSPHAHDDRGFRSIFHLVRWRSLTHLSMGNIFRRNGRVGSGPYRNGRSITWRPPASGHTTARFADLGAHPFASAPMAHLPDPAHTATSSGDELCYVRRSHISAQQLVNKPLPSLPNLRVRETNRTATRRRESSRGRNLSTSERALRAATGNAVPVSPRRASVSALSAGTCRSVPIPRVQRRTSNTSYESIRRSHVLIGTTRTIDIINRFPVPPPEIITPAKSSPVRLWTLFPRPNGPNNGNDPNRGSQGSNNSIVACQVSDNSDDHRQTPYIRGEANMRYRQSGAPIYDPDAASLRS